MICYVQPGGWTEIVATGPYTDAASVFDHSAFSEKVGAQELRKALRRHARWVKSLKKAADRDNDVAP
jgi:hypothetical protein